jgi:NAD(P)-dependent dehydrogenase (short-subunit alcohol dehydrogenase family)
MNLDGRIALVTGGGVRVGRAITLGLAEAGADVIVHYNHSAGPAEETVSLALQSGVEAVAIQANLGNPENAHAIVQTAQERFDGVDILVHAASPYVPASVFDVTLDAWRQLMGVVVESYLVLVQGLAPAMLARGEGAIIPILDRGAFDPWPDYIAHGTAKSALWALTRSLAVALAPQVRVNGIVPGPVLPPPDFTAEQTEQGAKATLLGRWGHPQDVADAVLYLARSDYVTGEVLFVDGGERWAHRLPQ